MLNESRVLHYIKDNLGFPFQFIEFSDEQIIEYIQTYTLREFSQYFPDCVTIGYNPSFAPNKVAGKSNEFYINDEQGREILGIKDIYFPVGDFLLHGHPPLGPMSMGELTNWVLSVEVSMWVKQFSSFDHTFEFKHPNVVRISPSPTNTDNIAIEYERIHSPEFETIQMDISHWFLELCLADIMIRIGRIRRRYSGGNLRTPFGDIPIEGEILDEGKEKKREILERLQTGSLPNVIVDFG